MWLNFGHIYGNGTVKVKILDETTEEEEQFSGARPLNIDFENYPIDTGWNKEGVLSGKLRMSVQRCM